MNQNIVLNGKEYKNVGTIVAKDSQSWEDVKYVETTSSLPASPEYVRTGDVFYVNGQEYAGTMPYYVAGDVLLTEVTQSANVDANTGYYTPWQVKIDPIEQQKIIGSNIRQGVTILGVPGTLSPTEGVNAQSKNVTPTKSSQIISPDDGYNYLSEVLVEPIPSQYIITTDADATADDILTGKSAYVNGEKVIGQHTDPQISVSNNVMIIR